jgi:hypothetical protein
VLRIASSTSCLVCAGQGAGSREQGALRTEPLRIAHPQQQRRFSKAPLMIVLKPPGVMAHSPNLYSSVLTYPSTFQQLSYFNHISQCPNLTLTQTLAEPNPSPNPAST